MTVRPTGSRELIKRYLPRVILETGPNRGGSSARNRGFALSSGEYIQYLDADDYLEADKIARQVQFLQETEADVVYGDWRYRRHLPDSSFSYLDRVQVSGVQQNILASLLSFWFVNGGAVLYRRHVIHQVGGWDETLPAAQDTDFLTTVALSGAKICYQPGCHFIYRKYGAVTVSTSSLGRWLEGMCTSLTKSEAILARTGRLTDEYKAALAVGYLEVARACYSFDARESFAINSTILDGLLNKILDLRPHFSVKNGSRGFIAVQWLFGFRRAMHLCLPLRAFVRVIRSGLRNMFLFSLVLRFRGVHLEREKDRRSASLTAT